jgi:hypothetical protein
VLNSTFCIQKNSTIQWLTRKPWQSHSSLNLYTVRHSLVEMICFQLQLTLLASSSFPPSVAVSPGAVRISFSLMIMSVPSTPAPSALQADSFAQPRGTDLKIAPRPVEQPKFFTLSISGLPRRLHVRFEVLPGNPGRTPLLSTLSCSPVRRAALG